MTVALVANVARPISSAISTAFSADSYGLLSSYGLIGGSTNPDAVIEALFANSEVGAWYDPSDLTTMFQDRAGTTPVTADGQTVGKILDKSGRGNHATAPSDAARPLYKTDGTYHWLQFDGVDDSLSTAAVDFTSTDKISVWGGVRKLSDASTGMIVEIGPGGGNGYFSLYNTASPAFQCISSGTIATSAGTPGLFASPITCVLTQIGDISGDSLELSVNGVIKGTSFADQGSGNYGGLPMYVGRRAGSSLEFNGLIYSLIALGRTATTQEITDTETWVAAKTGVTLP